MLIGRGQELALVGRRLEQERPFFVVAGEAGVGKTTLLRQAIEASDRPVFEGGGRIRHAVVDSVPSRLPCARAGDPGRRSCIRRCGGRATTHSRRRAVPRRPPLGGWRDARHRRAAGRSGRSCDGGADRGSSRHRRSRAARGRGRRTREDLRGLDDGDALSVVKRANPDVEDAVARRAVRAAGGNPLLLQELASSDDPSPSLKVSFAARLRSLTPAAREAAGLLAALVRSQG